MEHICLLYLGSPIAVPTEMIPIHLYILGIEKGPEYSSDVPPRLKQWALFSPLQDQNE